MRIGGRRWRRVLAYVLERDGRVCQLRVPDVCTIVATTADHVIPVSDRPELEFDPRNLRASCVSCNQYRGNRNLIVVPGPRPSPRWWGVFR